MGTGLRAMQTPPKAPAAEAAPAPEQAKPAPEQVKAEGKAE